MSAAAGRKAWIVATTIGAVEALKDQGICRWNYTIRSLHQHAKNNIRSFSQAKMLSSSSSSAAVSSKLREEKRRKAEEKMRKVMDLNCWGPNTAKEFLTMSGAERKVWVVAATIGAVEALKDQGICRWNYTIRSLHQHIKNSIRSFEHQAKMLSPSSSAAASNKLMSKSEERMRKVMDLSCWGPSTIRF
ncbi:2-nonaprenyl-3-methyl-6-methoxy-1,4-benzoquinol hydroxylase [Theobroma cacao]|uniref:2-nonaprenyl-3-methyl-6-methoxy-1,4-benzoquinol hydroxylase n=2 Tax=Theobroma cacao TaxID=3641 RepID=A0A061FE68_THECC|nr:2-nonaprenyl-3-methyl-6-methoxy-1,4-benzoquinol hydroxylase [Theobroma cacao]